MCFVACEMKRKDIHLNFDSIYRPGAEAIAAVLERGQKIRGNPVVPKLNHACAATMAR